MTDLSERQSTTTLRPVHILTPQNAYLYRPQNLLIAYCSSMVATVLVVLVGLFCIAAADSKTFDTLFSTVLRTTRNPELDEVVALSDSTGEKPLSTDLAKTRLRLRDNGRDTSDGKIMNDPHGKGLRTYFMLANDSDNLNQCSAALTEPDFERPEIGMTDVDSSLLPDEDSYPLSYADAGT